MAKVRKGESVQANKPGFGALAWLGSNWLAVVALVVSIATLLVTIGAWWQPQHKAESDKALDEHIDLLISEKTGPLTSKIDKLEGKLDELDPFIRSLVIKKMDQASSIPPKELLNRLPQFADVTAAARATDALVGFPTIDRLRSNLTALGREEPDQIGASWWKVSGDLLSLRTNPPSDLGARAREDCLARPHPHGRIAFIAEVTGLPSSQNPEYGFAFADCTLVLDDFVGLEKSVAYQDALKSVASGKVHGVFLLLTKVNVIYHGRAVLPVNAIIFESCAFDVHLDGEPQVPDGRKVTQTLLAANDFSKVQVTLLDAR